MLQIAKKQTNKQTEQHVLYGLSKKFIKWVRNREVANYRIFFTLVVRQTSTVLLCVCVFGIQTQFYGVFVKSQQIHQLFIQFINYVWWLLHVSALHCHPQGAFIVPSERCSIVLPRVAKTVTNIGKLFPCKMPTWFEGLTKFQQQTYKTPTWNKKSY
jgi:hypothetical protein